MTFNTRRYFDAEAFAAIGKELALLVAPGAPFDEARFNDLIKAIHALVGSARLSAEDQAHREHPESAVIPSGWARHTPDEASDYLRRYSKAMAVAPRAWAAWTEDEERELIESFRAGETLRSIAARHQRKLNAIRQRLQLLGLPPDRGLRAEGIGAPQPGHRLRGAE